MTFLFGPFQGRKAIVGFCIHLSAPIKQRFHGIYAAFFYHMHQTSLYLRRPIEQVKKNKIRLVGMNPPILKIFFITLLSITILEI